MQQWQQQLGHASLACYHWHCHLTSAWLANSKPRPFLELPNIELRNGHRSSCLILSSRILLVQVRKGKSESFSASLLLSFSADSKGQFSFLWLLLSLRWFFWLRVCVPTSSFFHLVLIPLFPSLINPSPKIMTNSHKMKVIEALPVLPL